MLKSLLSPFELPAESTSHRATGLRTVKPRESAVLADIEGAGCIQCVFMSMPPRDLRRLVLRFFWDDESKPSIECPVTDFFGVGHGLTTSALSSLLFYVAPKYGYNCYIPMPFGRRALVTITNETGEEWPGVYFAICYEKYAAPIEVPWRLHAAWRRVYPAYRRGQPLTLAEAKGSGRLLGVIYHVVKRDSDDRWTHGGADQILVDGDTARPSYVYGIGGEDFAHHAWGLVPGAGPFSGAHLVHPVPGVKRAEGPMSFEPHGFEQHDGGHYSMYRYFVPDPIRFKQSLRLSFGTAANEISATTYWYQSEPHASFCTLPPPEKRGYGVRLREEETLKPLNFGKPIPTAVLGPFLLSDEKRVWGPAKGVRLTGNYPTSVRQPYGDVVRPPYRVRWRRSEFRGGFLDLAAIHRPKCAIRVRGLWNLRHLPLGVVSHQLVRVRARANRRVILRIGFEDRVWVWLGRRCVGKLTCPEPRAWETQDVEIVLKRGWQDLVISHSQERMVRWSAWGLWIKFLNTDGAPADDLDFAPFPKLDPTPERFVEPWPPEEPVPTMDYRDPLMLV